ncbi:MAG: hypothetical protein ACREDM_13420 [Methylocella sp.]
MDARLIEHGSWDPSDKPPLAPQLHCNPVVMPSPALAYDPHPRNCDGFGFDVRLARVLRAPRVVQKPEFVVHGL